MADKIINIYILIGLPGSGKSTWTQNFLKDNPEAIVVSRDSIREIIKCGKYYFSPDTENIVAETAETMFITALNTKKFDIVVDETNLTKRRRFYWTRLAEENMDHPYLIHFIHLTEEKNNLKRRMTNSKGTSEEQWDKIIQQMRRNQQEVEQTECWDTYTKIDSNGIEIETITNETYDRSHN